MVVRGLNFEFAPLLHELRRLNEGVACGGTEYLQYNLVVDVSRANVCTIFAVCRQSGMTFRDREVEWCSRFASKVGCKGRLLLK